MGSAKLSGSSGYGARRSEVHDERDRFALTVVTATGTSIYQQISARKVAQFRFGVAWGRRGCRRVGSRHFLYDFSINRGL